MLSISSFDGGRPGEDLRRVARDQVDEEEDEQGNRKQRRQRAAQAFENEHRPLTPRSQDAHFSVNFVEYQRFVRLRPPVPAPG